MTAKEKDVLGVQLCAILELSPKLTYVEYRKQVNSIIAQTVELLTTK